MGAYREGGRHRPLHARPRYPPAHQRHPGLALLGRLEGLRGAVRQEGPLEPRPSRARTTPRVLLSPRLAHEHRASPARAWVAAVGHDDSLRGFAHANAFQCLDFLVRVPWFSVVFSI